MSESLLSADYSSLIAIIGWKIGAGRTSGSWTSAQAANVAAALASGLRMFYFPENGVDWTFLHPWKSITTNVGVREYDLPDDFGSIETDLTWKTETGPAYTVKQVAAERLRQVRQGISIANGRAEWFAVNMVPPSAASSTRWVLEFERGFDAPYVLEYRYRLVPNIITSTNTQPHGGAQHSETIIAACLAAAEWQIQSRRDIEYARYQERLQASMALDQRYIPARTGPYGQLGAELERPVQNIDLYYNGTLV